MSEELDSVEVDEIGETVYIDPLTTAGEMAAIINTIADADIMDIGSKQDCIDDCLQIIYQCNTILKQQIKEQYPIYFQPKKKKDGKNADTKVSAENDSKGAK